MSIVAFVPSFNEADTITATVEAIRAIPLSIRVLVVDDGSTDNTAALAALAGADVVRCERNVGKGAALGQGVAALCDRSDGGTYNLSPSSIRGDREPDGMEKGDRLYVPLSPLSHTLNELPPDIVLLLDGDLGASAREAESLLGPVIDGLADMTIGVLPKPPGSGGFGVVNDLARGAIRDWGGGYDAQAPLRGQRALTWECLQAVLPFAEGYGVEVALTIRALQQDFRVLEVMVDMQHRATGRDLPGFLHRARQYLDVRRTLKQLKGL
jgi:hypothetical protein